MKIIISHDVDHLYGRDHWFRDLIYPKLWIRSAIQLVKGIITPKMFWLRFVSCFQRRRHRLDEVMAFDRAHGVPSTFFFGMNQGLGMSYKPDEAKTAIQMVKKSGFAVGVHGICYDSYEGVQKEHDCFSETMGYEPDGIRMHYVRFNENTFSMTARAGYGFDCSEFNKAECGTIKAPYKVGNMWEFPLTVMDVYLPKTLEGMKHETLQRLSRSKQAGIEYVSILFHDYQFCDAYGTERDWYIWLIKYLENNPEYEFVSYKQAVEELESIDV